MKRGFTVLELLVASLLLGMLMTILTMIFSQSSIAWRTGLAGVADMDDVRKKISNVRYEADNAYIWKGKTYCIRSVFNDQGDFRTDRQIAEFYSDGEGESLSINSSVSDDDYTKSYGTPSIGTGTRSSAKNYVINVMSCGPDRNADTRYDNIYSLPDDPNNW